MSLLPILEYELFPLPERVNGVRSMKALSIVEKEMCKQVNAVKGSAVLIQDADLPTWYYLLLFKHLYPFVPEIVIEVEPHFQIVLYTIYRKDEYTRPESVHLFSGLLPSRVSSAVSRVEEYKLDLSSFPNADDQDLRSIISSIKTQIKHAENVQIIGKADPVISLICYVLSRQDAKRIVYKNGSIEIAL